MPTERQTVSFLRRKFAEIGLEPNARHGQNFLIDLNLLDFLARCATLDPSDLVLEIGTGTASLTTRLAEQAGHVITVEIDHHLFDLAQEQLASHDNVTMLQVDALKNKNRMQPVVIETVRRLMAETSCERFKLVANLPYNIATAIIANLLGESPHPTQMTVTIQKELADRIVAEPRTKDYGSLSVWVQSLGTAEIERILPPTVFWPRPKVHSAIITIRSCPDRRARFGDLAWYHSFIRSIFLHRRKFLRGVLLASYKRDIDKRDIDEVLDRLQLGPDTRTEQLTVDQIIALAAQFERLAKQSD